MLEMSAILPFMSAFLPFMSAFLPFTFYVFYPLRYPEFSTQLLTLNYLLYSPTDAAPQFL